MVVKLVQTVDKIGILVTLYLVLEHSYSDIEELCVLKLIGELMEVQEVWVKATVHLHEIWGYEINENICSNPNSILGLNMENVLQ